MFIDKDTQERPPIQGRRWLAYLLGGFGLAASAQVNFLVPLRARELGAGLDVIGLIAGVGAIVTALSSIPAGAVIDRLGPRTAFLAGAVSTCVASLMLVAVDDYWHLLLLKPIYGASRNLAWLASQAYVGLVSHPESESRNTGRFGLFGNLGQMVGPVVAGIGAGTLGLKLSFLVPATYAGLFVVLGLALDRVRTDRHSAVHVAQGSGAKSALRLLAVRSIQVALMLTFVRLWTSHLYSTFYSVFLVEAGINASFAGIVVGAAGLVAAVVSTTSGYWTRRATPERVTTLALSCSAAALLVAPSVEGLPWVFTVPILHGIGAGLSLPLLISIVSRAAPSGQRGVALGLRGLVNQSAATAAPLLIGPLMASIGLSVGLAVGGVAGGIVLCVASALHRFGRISRFRRRM